MDNISIGPTLDIKEGEYEVERTMSAAVHGIIQVIRLNGRPGTVHVAKYHKEGKKHLFIQETAVLSKLKHVNIINLVGFIRHHGAPIYDYYSLELMNILPGAITGVVTNLRQFLSQLDTTQLLHDAHTKDDHLNTIVRGIVSGLRYLHGENIVHFNIEPTNILLSETSGIISAKIGGFSRAVLYNNQTDFLNSPSLDDTGKVTLFFSAPELLLAKSTQLSLHDACKCDMWSFGALVYCILNADVHHPYQIETERLDLPSAKKALYSLYQNKESAAYSYKYERLQQGEPDLEEVLQICMTFNTSARSDAETICRKIMAERPHPSRYIARSKEFWDYSDEPKTLCFHNVPNIDGFKSYLSTASDCPIKKINAMEHRSKKFYVEFQRTFNLRRLKVHLSGNPFKNCILSCHVIPRIVSVVLSASKTVPLSYLSDKMKDIEQSIAAFQMIDADSRVMVTFKNAQGMQSWLKEDLQVGEINIQKRPFYSCNKPDSPLNMADLRKFLDVGKSDDNSADKRISFDEIMVRNEELINQYPFIDEISGFLKTLFMLNSACVQSDMYKGANIVPFQTVEEYPKPYTKNVSPNLHPQDLLTTSLLVSDPVVMRTIYSKAFLCKLAIPILIKNPSHQPGSEFIKLFHGLKGIILPVLTRRIHTEVNAYFAPMKIISFFGVTDKCCLSKSETMNALMSDICESPIPTFFHRNCPGGKLRRKSSNGTVEGAYYLPSDSQSGIFSSELMFLNLRGDAMTYSKQTTFLLTVSFISVMFVGYKDLWSPQVRPLYSQLEGKDNQYFVIVAVADEPKSAAFDHKARVRERFRKIFSPPPRNVYLIDTRNSEGDHVNAAELRYTLQQVITHIIKECKTPLCNSFSSIDDTPFDGIATDKAESKVMASTKESLNRLMPFLPQSGDQTLQLPLQESAMQLKKVERKSLSEDISLLEEIHITEIAVHKYNNVLETKVLEQALTNENHLCLVFLREMSLVLQNHKAQLGYYVDSVHILLNKWSHEKYHNHNEQYMDASCSINQCRNNLETIAQLDKEQNYFFGLQLLFRELAITFETINRLFDNPDQKEKLMSTEYCTNVLECPNIMAKLINCGMCFEILDGDSSGISILWLNVVLEKLSEEIDHSKIIVLSVIGIQSSGKSTILNALFGIGFPVSAGGCTKGVFAQLVRVENQNFDFILVLDSEGIRGTDGTECLRKDNEMVTFVVGISDIVIINVKGELYVDVADVLEVAVHAFMRMYLQHKPRHCMFVHQNVSASDAGAKLAPRRRRLVNTLNSAVAKASKKERILKSHSFKDIMYFDENGDTFYLGDVWLGEPPMAPTSPHYFQKVTKVKQCIFQKASKLQPRKLTNMGREIQALWDGIKSNDFIFLYKDQHELDKMDSSMVSSVNNGTIKLRQYVLEYISTEANKVFQNCTTKEQLNGAETDLLAQQKIQLRQIAEEEWKHGTASQSLQLSEQLMNQYLKLAYIKMNTKVAFMKEKRWYDIWNDVIDQLGQKDLKEELKKIASEVVKSGEPVSSRFDEFWDQHKPDVYEQETDIQFSYHVQHYMKMINPDLNDVFTEHKRQIQQAIENDKVIMLIDDLDLTADGPYVIPHKEKKSLKAWLVKSINNKTPEDSLKKLMENVAKHLTVCILKPRPFSRQSISDLHSLVIDHMVNHKNLKAEKRGFEFTKFCEEIMAIRIMLYAEKTIVSSHRSYSEHRGYGVKLRKQEQILRNLFLDEVQQLTSKAVRHGSLSNFQMRSDLQF